MSKKTKSFLSLETNLKNLGHKILKTRKTLKISAVALAEMAQISRVTLHRIEKGKSSVAMESYLKVLNALGLTFKVEPYSNHKDDLKVFSLPTKIYLKNYPSLKSLAWQVTGVDSLTPKEAFDIYERNQHHLDHKNLTQDEFDLMQALRLVFEKKG